VDRRSFIATMTGSLLAAPLGAEAQQAGKVPRIGYLLPSAKRPSNEAFWEACERLATLKGRTSSPNAGTRRGKRNGTQTSLPS
jgi:hypothetical protein